jgi:hypothetical protein
MADYCRVARRVGYSPDDTLLIKIGFRVARTPSP